MWATSEREPGDYTMPRPVALERIDGIATAKAVRALMPSFDTDAALALIEAWVIDAARVGREQVDAISAVPKHDGNLTASYIAECRDQISRALQRAGYKVTYNSGGHMGAGSLVVSWAKQ